MRYKLPAFENLEHSLGIFVDQGGWNYERGPFPAKRQDSLADIGLGYYLSFGPFSMKAQLVHGLGEYPSELKKEPQTNASLLFMLSF